MVKMLGLALMEAVVISWIWKSGRSLSPPRACAFACLHSSWNLIIYPFQIWDSYSVKAQTFKTAIEAACMLLRIDDIVSGIKKKQAPGASSAPKQPQIEQEGDADNEQIIPE